MGLVSLRTSASFGAIDQTETALEQAWSGHGHVPDAIRRQTGIAVAEVVANIVEHGSAGRDGVRIEMEIAVHADHVLVTVIDNGNEAHVDLGAIRMPDDLAERGRGLAMAKLVLDRFDYRRQAGLNCWTLASRPFQAAASYRAWRSTTGTSRLPLS